MLVKKYIITAFKFVDEDEVRDECSMQQFIYF